MQRIFKILASILICISIYAIVGAIHSWSIGSAYPMAFFFYIFYMALIFGSWLFILALIILFKLTSYYKKATVYIYLLAGSLMGIILPLFTGMNFFDLQGFRVDFIAYFLSGAMFGWLYYHWLLKDTRKFRKPL